MALELEILETSFDLIAPRGEELVDFFYTRLFETGPAVEPLFANTDLRKQKSMLLATLVLLRKSLRSLDAIAPKLRELGARHVAYGALPEHYPVVAEVLLASMAEIAGEAWTGQIAVAWTTALGLVATAMLEGAEEAQSQRRDESLGDVGVLDALIRPTINEKGELMMSPKKSMLGLALLAALASALVFAGGALAAEGGNAANAKLCQKGGWQTLMDSSATAFAGGGECVSYSAHGGAFYALASLDVEPCATQPFDGLCVSTNGFGLAPTTFVTTPLLKNAVAVTTEFLVVQADGTVSGSPFAHFEAPCVAGNVYSATATGTSADSLSAPTAPGIPITSNTVTRTSSCP